MTNWTKKADKDKDAPHPGGIPEDEMESLAGRLCLYVEMPGAKKAGEEISAALDVLAELLKKHRRYGATDTAAVEAITEDLASRL